MYSYWFEKSLLKITSLLFIVALWNRVDHYIFLSALNKQIIWILIPCTDLTPIMNKYIHNKWQQDWNSQTQNKLQQICLTIPPQSSLPVSFQRSDQMLYNRNRLHIRHTCLTHSYLIDHSDPPECTKLSSATFCHTHRECISYTERRHQYYFHTNLKKIYSVILPSKVC